MLRADSDFRPTFPKSKGNVVFTISKRLGKTLEMHKALHLPRSKQQTRISFLIHFFPFFFCPLKKKSRKDNYFVLVSDLLRTFRRKREQSDVAWIHYIYIFMEVEKPIHPYKHFVVEELPNVWNQGMKSFPHFSVDHTNCHHKSGTIFIYLFICITIQFITSIILSKWRHSVWLMESYEK